MLGRLRRLRVGGNIGPPHHRRRQVGRRARRRGAGEGADLHHQWVFGACRPAGVDRLARWYRRQSGDVHRAWRTDRNGSARVAPQDAADRNAATPSNLRALSQLFRYPDDAWLDRMRGDAETEFAAHFEHRVVLAQDIAEEFTDAVTPGDLDQADHQQIAEAAPFEVAPDGDRVFGLVVIRVGKESGNAPDLV